MSWFHPSHAELAAHAEGMSERGGRVAARIAGHVSACTRCKLRVEALRGTFEVVAAAGDIDVSRECNAQLLLAARDVRGHMARRRWERRTVGVTLMGATAVACMVFVSTIANDDSAISHFNAPSLETSSVTALQASVFPMEGLQRQNDDADILSAAIHTDTLKPRGAWEQAQLRTVETLDEDITEAMNALKNNPFCVRAKNLIDTSRTRLTQELKTLYVERSL